MRRRVRRPAGALYRRRVILAYPWFAVPVLVVVCALLVNRAQRRRAAIAARADHEHRQQIAGAVFAELRMSPILPAPAPVMNRWPTTRHRRAADHWSATDPIRQATPNAHAVDGLRERTVPLSSPGAFPAAVRRDARPYR